MHLDPCTFTPLPGSPGTTARWWVGIDGGGTTTRAVRCDSAGHVIARGEAGPSALGQGVAQAWRHIAAAVEHTGVPLAECALGLGLSGVSVPANLRDFLTTAPPHAGGAVVSDGLAAVLGAHGGAPGGILIAGTGSVGEALLPSGTAVQVGGWGWQLGDEGSGAWLGRRAMQLAHRALDGRSAAGPLARAVWAEAGADREALLAWCARAGQNGFAGLAPQVFAHEHDDPAAAALLAAAAAALHTLADALDPEGHLPLALGGSIAQRLAARFAPSLHERLVPPQGDAAEGALRLIRHLRAPAP